MAAKRKSSPAQGEGRGDATRLALIRAALDLFGAKGFEAASTRDVAAAAGANLASIAYHFGGKEGLRARLRRSRRRDDPAAPRRRARRRRRRRR